MTISLAVAALIVGLGCIIFSGTERPTLKEFGAALMWAGVIAGVLALVFTAHALTKLFRGT